MEGLGVDLVPIIIEFMESLFTQIFSIAEHPVLQQWGNNAVAGIAEDTEKQVVNQLGYDPTD